MKIKCAFNGCDRDSKCKGYCDMHYRRFLHKGNVNDRGAKVVDTGSDLDRFHKKYIIDDETGCWNWIGGARPNAKGVLYGRHWAGNKSVGAHRYSFMHFNGKITDKNFICHKCDNPLCVNPAHLFQGSHLDNMFDMVNKNRSCKSNGEYKVGRAKLTNDQAREILSADLTYGKLAKKYSVSASVIGRIKRGESYASAS